MARVAVAVGMRSMLLAWGPRAGQNSIAAALSCWSPVFLTGVKSW